MVITISPFSMLPELPEAVTLLQDYSSQMYQNYQWLPEFPVLPVNAAFRVWLTVFSFGTLPGYQNELRLVLEAKFRL